MLTVDNIMTREIVTISPDASIRDAIDLLLARRISGLPVVDGHDRLVGILTEFALLALAYDKDIANHKVSDHMTHEVLTVEASDPVNKVADLCIVHRVRRLPVVENGCLTGMISRRDVLSAIYEAAPPVAAC